MIIPLLIKSEQNRYELRKGKFGCYFHDSEIMVDMSLEMVLNRLNISERNRESQLKAIKYLNKEMFDLKNTIRELNKTLDVYKKSVNKLE